MRDILSNMQYTQVDIRLSQATDFAKDLLTAQLADLGFDTFVDTDSNSFSAYIPSAQLQEQTLCSLLHDFAFAKAELLAVNPCEDKDWNAEWERNSFQPIIIGDECCIHAPFHTNLPHCRYDIVINPKMAFGTGTHQTTSLIIQALLQLPLQDKAVLDMGCGTGILAILARLRGACPVTAIDIDNWCTDNAKENCTLNHINDIEILLGDARLLQNRHFDLIIANINRNILLMDMPSYAAALNPNGTLLLSGFYTEDIPVLQTQAESLGLACSQHHAKDNWALLCLQSPKR